MQYKLVTSWDSVLPMRSLHIQARENKESAGISHRKGSFLERAIGQDDQSATNMAAESQYCGYAPEECKEMVCQGQTPLSLCFFFSFLSGFLSIGTSSKFCRAFAADVRWCTALQTGKTDAWGDMRLTSYKKTRKQAGREIEY